MISLPVGTVERIIAVLDKYAGDRRNLSKAEKELVITLETLVQAHK